MAVGYHERFKKLIEDIRSDISIIKPGELFQEIEENNKTTVIDVREGEEWKMSHIPQSISVSKANIERDIEYFVPNTKRKIVLYSLEGDLSLIAAHNLMKMGYENVYSLKGGYHAWTIAGYPIQEKGEIVYPEKQEKEGKESTKSEQDTSQTKTTVE